jgi:hypothetical protein
MPYGPRKFSAGELNTAIAEVISDSIKNHLGSCSEFSNTSLAYMGVKFDYSIHLTFLARKESELTVSASQTVMGEGCRPQDVNKQVTATVKGEHAAGSYQKGKHKKAAPKTAAA